MRRNRRTKLIATLGPSSSSEALITELYEAGVDVFRINMSHTSHEVLETLVKRVRAVELRFGDLGQIGVMVDLQGPKLRVGTFQNEKIILKNNAVFRLDSDPTPGNETRVYLPHPEILLSVAVGDRLFLDDGKVILKVARVGENFIETNVLSEGALSNRKGVSLPDTVLAVGSLTEKDYADLDAALQHEIDWIAVSFIQRPEDLIEIREIIQGRALIMSKIEKPRAVEYIEEIILNSDAVMVARGDLGVEMPLECVPGVQKKIISLSRQHAKPVVVATQMLESMIQSPSPTRAEVSDVATAVFEGVDAVMLSAETASGKFPVTSVATMSRITEAVEKDSSYDLSENSRWERLALIPADAIAVAARAISAAMEIGVIIAWSSSGTTAFRIARERPTTPILILTSRAETARRLALLWGVYARVSPDPSGTQEMLAIGSRVAEEVSPEACVGRNAVFIAGIPFGTPGTTNTLRILPIV